MEYRIRIVWVYNACFVYLQSLDDIELCVSAVYRRTHCSEPPGHLITFIELIRSERLTKNKHINRFLGLVMQISICVINVFKNIWYIVFVTFVYNNDN